MRKYIIDKIFSIAKQSNAFELLEKDFSSIKKGDLVNNLIEVGVMPEVFEHDSSEEKLWAKYSDIILSRSLEFLGLFSEVIRLRGNSADVLAKADNYSVVGDAKCFRLSRTAKNQKDFKIKALDDWRRENTYAILVCPLFQYPTDRSQIYSQAINKNVTLISYTHLKFLLNYTDKPELDNLWKTGLILNKRYSSTERQRGKVYWKEIDNIVCKIAKQKYEKLVEYKIFEIKKTKELGLEGINYWNSKINEFHKLDRNEAIRLLIHSQKIEQKILTIEKTINKEYIL